MESDFDFDRWAETDEWPHHFLYLPDYYLAKTPVTNVQYLVFVRSTDYEPPEEWEKGARGVNGRIYPWGNEWDAKKCNCVENGSNNITPVDAYPDGASPYGLLDMVGNIYEWTLSLWGTNGKKPDFMYPYRLDDGREDMTANNNIYRILRGGAFIAPSFEHRCAIRLRRLPNDKAMGFRVAMFPF